MGILKKKHSKDIQKLDLEIFENPNTIKCYNHFKEKLFERFSQDLSYDSYLLTWTAYLRGSLIEIKGNIMYRVIGDYIKDKVVYKVIYTRDKYSKLFIPLTIYPVVEHKKKYNIYKKVLKNKK